MALSPHARQLAWENKLAKGFSTTGVLLEFCLRGGEAAEAFKETAGSPPG